MQSDTLVREVQWATRTQIPEIKPDVNDIYSITLPSVSAWTDTVEMTTSTPVGIPGQVNYQVKPTLQPDKYLPEVGRAYKPEAHVDKYQIELLGETGASSKIAIVPGSYVLMDAWMISLPSALDSGVDFSYDISLSKAIKYITQPQILRSQMGDSASQYIFKVCASFVATQVEHWVPSLKIVCTASKASKKWLTVQRTCSVIVTDGIWSNSLSKPSGVEADLETSFEVVELDERE